ncbi:MAG: hypothetical protein JSU70_19610 [Phycisphaerales bacterium]|nr:MAG: hypothetical protein JSU70_19610 [Phycisphaerales bacterium]
MSGDELIPESMLSITHAITIKARPEQIWPWLAQMGAGRAGWYSWDFIDNGNARSARSILPEYQNIAVGDVLPAIPGAEDAFVLDALDPGRNLVLTVPCPSGGLLVSWEFVLEGLEYNKTRLIVRARVSETWLRDMRGQVYSEGGPILVQRMYAILGIIPRWIMLPVARIGHRIMEARMLRGIKRRAESLSRCLN